MIQKMHKKIADPDCHQNQRLVRQDVEPLNISNFITFALDLQEGNFPFVQMPEETAESWNAKARRINREAAERRALDERWEAAV